MSTVDADLIRMATRCVIEVKRTHEQKAAEYEQTGDWKLALREGAFALGLECAAEMYAQLLEPSSGVTGTSTPPYLEVVK